MIRTFVFTISVLGCLLLVVGLWLLRGVFARRRWTRRVEKATKSLAAQIESLEAAFLQAAATRGTPRGLTWKSCEFDPHAVLVRDRNTDDLYALVRVTIGFEAVAGGDMEHIEAVANLRSATALLEWRDGGWTTHGRALFNLDPHEAVAHYRRNLEVITECPLTADEG